MKFKEILSRLTGISCPIFGVSWNPSKPEVVAARRIVNILEDRRVLYNPHELEDPQHCMQSVIEIRRVLTDELNGSGVSGDLAASLKAMRAACRKFLDRVQPTGAQSSDYFRRPFGASEFFDALGEMRGVFGVHLAQIAVRYGLDVEGHLSSILPGLDEADDRKLPRQRSAS